MDAELLADDRAAAERRSRIRSERVRTIERIRNMQPSLLIPATNRVELVCVIVTDEESESNAVRARYELAQAEATVARLQRDFPADVR